MFRIGYAFRVQCILTSPNGEYCINKSKETVNKSWIHYASMAFEDNPNKNRQKQTFLNLTAYATNK